MPISRVVRPLSPRKADRGKGRPLAPLEAERGRGWPLSPHEADRGWVRPLGHAWTFGCLFLFFLGRPGASA